MIRWLWRVRRGIEPTVFEATTIKLLVAISIRVLALSSWLYQNEKEEAAKNLLRDDTNGHYSHSTSVSLRCELKKANYGVIQCQSQQTSSSSRFCFPNKNSAIIAKNEILPAMDVYCEVYWTLIRGSLPWLLLWRLKMYLIPKAAHQSLN